MSGRALWFVLALAASVPAAAQTPVVNIQAGADVGGALFSPRGDKVAALVGRDRIVVWSLPDGKPVETVSVSAPPSSLLFARHADEILVGLRDGSIVVRALGSSGATRQMKADVGQSVLATSADGRFLASAADERITIWEGGRPVRTFGHDFGDVGYLAFSPDATLLASAGYDANVHVWDVATGQRKATVREQRLATFALAFTVDGRSLVMGGAGGTIEIADVATASIVRRFPAQRHAVYDLTLSPDSRSLAVAHFDVDSVARPAPLTVWDLTSGRMLRRVLPPGTRPQAVVIGADGRVHYALLKGSELSVWSVAAPGKASRTRSRPD